MITSNTVLSYYIKMLTFTGTIQIQGVFKNQEAGDSPDLWLLKS